MALVPQFYQVSTKALAELRIKQGVLRYPGVCFIKEDGGYLSWVTKDNTLDFVSGYKQITDVTYNEDGYLCFMTGDDVLYAADTAVSPEMLDRIQEEIVNNIDLAEYTKVSDVSDILDSRIGDIGDKSTVVDYIDTLSYDSLGNTPIINLYGEITKPVVISNLDDGVYKISGQFKIGGSYNTVQISSEGALFVVARMHTDNSTVITQILGNAIKIYTIASDGTGRTDRYITESYINQKDFITSGEVKEYVKSIVKDAIVETIDQVLDERLDAVLEDKFDYYTEQDIISIFQK